LRHGAQQYHGSQSVSGTEPEGWACAVRSFGEAHSAKQIGDLPVAAFVKVARMFLAFIEHNKGNRG
jgi:hypothetical protein